MMSGDCLVYPSSCSESKVIKMQAAWLLLALCAVARSLRRGPHHPHGQTPVLQRHHHYKPRGVALTKDTEVLRDAKHIEEDAKLTPEAVASMTPEELEFHYFSAHDFDQNSKLDGLELLKAVYHTMEHDAPEPVSDSSIEPEANDLESYIALVDRTLQSDDTDSDGFISYAEYRAARQRHNTSTIDRTPIVVAVNNP